jgi:hypothetical protein
MWKGSTLPRYKAGLFFLEWALLISPHRFPTCGLLAENPQFQAICETELLFWHTPAAKTL